MAAQDTVVGDHRQQVQRRTEVDGLGEVLGDLDLERQLLGQGLERLHAAHVGAGQEPADRLVGQPRGQRLGLRPARFREGPQVIRTVPPTTLACFGVPNQVQRHRTGHDTARPRSGHPVSPSVQRGGNPSLAFVSALATTECRSRGQERCGSGRVKLAWPRAAAWPRGRWLRRLVGSSVGEGAKAGQHVREGAEQGVDVAVRGAPADADAQGVVGIDTHRLEHG